MNNSANVSFTILETNLTETNSWSVSVVLRGPKDTTCRTEAVYCSVYCETSYKYGSTKGCPEDPCACLEEKLKL